MSLGVIVSNIWITSIWENVHVYKVVFDKRIENVMVHIVSYSKKIDLKKDVTVEIYNSVFVKGWKIPERSIVIYL